MTTLAEALRTKKQLVEKLTRLCPDILDDVVYLKSEEKEVNFKENIKVREKLKKEILDLKQKITHTNYKYGIIDILQKFGEVKGEIAFWKEIKEARLSRDSDFSSSRVSKFLRRKRNLEVGPDDWVLYSITKEKINEIIDDLTENLSKMDMEIQNKNHTVILLD